ncbi:hypothetical protein [Enterobacter hormaechei]|uniref:hypothetical protein n=1 Tax=Enterobacter hormaechei TaxID=158836 RepID=UPI001EF55705|nr:hypothetical protein [Enterobacter hormaechei]
MFSKPMTTFTPERIEQILEFAEGSNPSEAMSLRADEVAVLARIGKAVMSIAPVYQCEFCHHDATGQLQWHWEDVNKAFYDKYDPDRRGRRRILYTAPPMPLVSADLLNILHLLLKTCSLTKTEVVRECGMTFQNSYDAQQNW